MAGLGSMPQKSEGVSTIYDDPISGNTKRYTHLSWGLGFRITHEAYEDDLYGMLGKKMSGQLAKSARNAQEVHAHAILNNAFAASATASTLAAANTFDGYSLCNVAHVRLGGGTQANRSSIDEDLSFMVSHYLTDSDSWFLIADKGVHGLNFFWREKATFKESDDFDTGDG